MGWVNPFGSDCNPRQEPCKSRILLIEIFQSFSLLLDECKDILRLVDLISVLRSLKNGSHDSEVD